MGFRGGGQIDPPPPSISWFSSTPAEIGLKPQSDWRYLTFFVKGQREIGRGDGEAGGRSIDPAS